MLNEGVSVHLHILGNYDFLCRYGRTPEEVLAENAKLRELVQYACDECYGDDWFVEKAAALGIEGHY